MPPNQASQTAEYMALFRAIESARPLSRRLFSDPFARGFLRPSLRIAASVASFPLLGNIIPWIIDYRWPGARPSGVARTRLIDDTLCGALHDGVQQVVILGAGFDCRAYRIAEMDRVRVIEVDQPDTQQAKRERLQRIFGGVPKHVQLVAVDFNCQRLEDVIEDADFDKNCRTFFLWEGVTNYLTAQAVDVTFRAIREIAQSSLVLFSYVDKAMFASSAKFEGTGTLNRTLQRAGENWTFGFDPSELPEYLAQRGFRLIDDLGSVKYREHYLGAHRRLLRGYEFYRVAQAESQT
jgi:methyltransferase (TIGR00027 family)